MDLHSGGSIASRAFFTNSVASDPKRRLRGGHVLALYNPFSSTGKLQGA
jgi:hypothetical protein